MVHAPLWRPQRLRVLATKTREKGIAMKNVFRTALALTFALALTSTGSSVAYAHEFLASKTGPLTGSADNSQEFEVEEKGEFVLCGKLSVTGEVTALKAADQAIVVQYEECKANTFLGELCATISPADYTLLVDGEIMITKPIEINICGIATQTIGDQEIGPVTYSNTIAGIIINVNVSGIHSSGGLGSKEKGTYTGEFFVSLEGGTIEWK